MDTRTIEELKKLAEAKPVAWSRSDRFVNHYREMTDRPENATSDVNEWKALYSEETVAALIERVERAEAENARLREALERIKEKASLGVSYGLLADGVCEEILGIVNAALEGKQP